MGPEWRLAGVMSAGMKVEVECHSGEIMAYYKLPHGRVQAELLTISIGIVYQVQVVHLPHKTCRLTNFPRHS